jgi:hypothetical protein
MFGDGGSIIADPMSSPPVTRVNAEERLEKTMANEKVIAKILLLKSDLGFMIALP